jgi:hypothetical protein
MVGPNNKLKQDPQFVTKNNRAKTPLAKTRQIKPNLVKSDSGCCTLMKEGKCTDLFGGTEEYRGLELK